MSIVDRNLKELPMTMYSMKRVLSIVVSEVSSTRGLQDK